MNCDLEEIIEEYLSRYRAGENPFVEDYCQRCPQQADTIRELLDSLTLMEELSETESTLLDRTRDRLGRTSLPPNSKLGEFQIVREMGRGGMGVVYEAIDSTLGRRVALKLLHPSLAKTHDVHRFRRESRLAAQLHHTNIVSVFGVGVEGDVHFYAMQFVDGRSVEQVVQCLRNGQESSRIAVTTDDRALQAAERLQDSISRGGAAPNAPVRPMLGADGSLSVPGASEDGTSDVGHTGAGVRSGFGRAYWRNVASLGMQVAEALHYAHDKGILHRDIKPANLLIDVIGSVWVADFGLAKPTEHDDVTKTGDVVGTLKYMAPEQLSGKADARTDIYGLGQSLYELLTLRPTCDETSYEGIIAQKRQGKWLAPRKCDPAIPRDLETIVQKSLAPEPGKRYASAQAMADDLQRFLDDRPIRARRATAMEHGWRWARRNKGVACWMSLCTLLILLLPVVFGWAYVRESIQQRQTVRTLGVALDGFDELFRSFVEEDLLSSSELGGRASPLPGKSIPVLLTRDNARILERMLVFYDRLSAANLGANDSVLQAEAARARRRVGDLYRRLGQFDKATEAYLAALERYRPLERDDLFAGLEMVRIQQALGLIHAQQQDHDAAQEDYKQAMSLLASLPSQSETRFELARTHYLLGRTPSANFLRYDPPRPERRVPPFPQRRPPPPPRPPQADQAHLQAAIQLLETLHQEEPNAAKYGLLLARCLRETASNAIFYEDEDSPRARAASLLRALVSEFPQISKYRFELSETYRGTGQNRVRREQWQRYIDQLLTARQILTGLVESQSQVASYRLNLAYVGADLATACERNQDLQRAESFSREAIVSHALVVRDFPGLAPLSSRLAGKVQVRLGEWLLRQHRWEEAVELIRPLGESLHRQSMAAGHENRRELLKQRDRCARILMRAYSSLGAHEQGEEIACWLRPDPRQLEHLSRDPLAQMLDSDGDRVISSDELSHVNAMLKTFDSNRNNTLTFDEVWGHIAEFVSRDAGMETHRVGRSNRDRRPIDLRRRRRAIEGIFSFDTNDDQRLTRDELPARMGQEWFGRFDMNQDQHVDASEVRSHFGTIAPSRSTRRDSAAQGKPPRRVRDNSS